MMLHKVAGRDFVVLFPGLNVSMFAVSGETLQCLPYLAELGVALSHCLPHWSSLCPMNLEQQKRRLLLHRSTFVLIHRTFRTALCLFRSSFNHVIINCAPWTAAEFIKSCSEG